MRRTTAWVDFAGRERMTHLTGQTATEVPATWAAIAGCSEADYLGYWQGGVVPVLDADPITSVPYITAGYVLALELIDPSGNVHRIFLPAPLTAAVGDRLSLLKSDRQTLDNTTVQADSLGGTFQFELQHPLSTENITDMKDGWVTHAAAALTERLGFGDGFDTVRRCVEWIDASGRHFTTLLTSRAGAPLSMDNLQLYSAAATLRFWEGPVVKNLTPNPGTLDYAGIAEEAILIFSDATGEQTRLTIPAPQRTIFRADGKTVDETMIAVAGVIAAALTEIVVPATALPVVSYVGGMYSYNRQYGQ
jgi:hypothetical protein